MTSKVMSNKSLQIGNKQIKTPPYYHRQFEHDLPQASNKDDQPHLVKRVALVALPYICLYKPIGKAVTTVMDGNRVLTSIYELTKSEKDHGKALLKSALAISSFACTLLAHPLGVLVTTGNDLIINIDGAANGIKNHDMKKTLESVAHIANNSLYLGMFFVSSLELMVLSFSTQILFGLYNSSEELKKGNKLEALGHLGMSAIRINQLRPQINILQFKWQIEKELKESEIINISTHHETKIKDTCKMFFSPALGCIGLNGTNLLKNAEIRDSELHKAFAEKDISTIIKLINDGYDLNEKDFFGRSILYKCFLKENGTIFFNLIPILLNHGADPNFKYAGESILHLAVNNCFTSCAYMITPIRELMKHGASFDHKYLGKTPPELCFDWYKNKFNSNTGYDLMSLFFEYGHSPNQIINGRHVYIDFGIKRNYNGFLSLLLKYNVDLSIDNGLLAYAIKGKDLDYVLDIINRGAKIRSGHLAVAFEAKKYNLVPILIQKGAVIDSLVIGAVIRTNNLEGLKILKGMGADLKQNENSHLNSDVYSSKFIYSQFDPSIIEYLVKECNWDVDFKDQYNSTPLYSAYSYGNFQAILVLLQLGASLEPRIPSNTFTLKEYLNRNRELVAYLRRYGYYIDRRS